MDVVRNEAMAAIYQGSESLRADRFRFLIGPILRLGADSPPWWSQKPYPARIRQRLDMLFPGLPVPLPHHVSTGLLAAGLTPLLHAISMTQGGHVHAQLHRP